MLLKPAIRFLLANPMAMGLVVFQWFFWVVFASALFFAVGISGKLGTWNPIALITSMTKDVHPVFATLFVLIGLLWSGLIGVIILGPSFAWIAAYRPPRLKNLLQHTLAATGKRLLAPAFVIAAAFSIANHLQGLPWSDTLIVLANLLGFILFATPFVIGYISGSAAIWWSYKRLHATDYFLSESKEHAKSP